MSSRRRRIQRRSTLGAGRFVIGGGVLLLVSLLVLLLAGGLTAYAVARTWLEDLPDYESPDAFNVAQATKIYSADGELLARLYLEDRTVVPMSKISTDLASAVVAVEDERFYQHDGIDLYGIARAAVKDLMTGNADEGASTITQQYIRNTVLLNERTDISFQRKVREAFLAMELEKRKSKEEILELYLNAIYYGEGAYGAQAASRVFFSKSADELTLPEAALLAGLPQQPSRLSPYDNPEGAVKRRDEVLRHMLDQSKITQAEYDEAVAAPLKLKRAEEPENGIFRVPYYVAYVKKVLQQKFDQATVFKGGLTVYTTIDLKRQKMAEDAVKSQLGKPSDPDVALVSIDPRNGHIVAMVGGRDYSKNKFNLATQGKRQPGSSFKTFVLVTALKEGMPPYRYVDSSSPARIPSNPVWTVGNSEGSGHGRISLESATRASVNTVFARLIWELNDKESTGAEKVADTAHDMGIMSEIPPYPSIALGSQNVSPLEMASAYGTLATNGKHAPVTAITKVVDSQGKTIYKADDEAEQVLKPEIAYAATSILKGVISGGTATRARIGRPAAGKTGTSQNYRDAWFVGYTPQLVTSVWVGYYKAEKSMRYVNGVRGFGGTLAAPIWAKYMTAALKGEKALDFPKERAPKYTWKSDWSQNQDIEVPDVVGLTLAKAKALLGEADLKLSSKTEYSSKVPKGKIISQSPKAGGRAKQGSTVKVVVSNGKKPAPKPSKPTTHTVEPTSTP